MKKIYRVETNGYWMLFTDDGEVIRYLTDSNDFDAETFPLAEVEDDSSWEMYETEDFEEFLGTAKITEEAEANC